MAIRYLKIVLVAFVALQALAYATQNLVNLEGAYQSVVYVMSSQDHIAYPNSFVPALNSPALAWIALAIILIGEYSAGALAAMGCYQMWTQRRAAASFHEAKHYALMGCMVSVVVWFGMFLVIGGAMFQMWQTEIGANSLSGAFQYSTQSALILLILYQEEQVK